ncbi:MAG: hypothetical protein HQL76_00700 [Magnetococcales bacterium]|nr:hypothetical protein [Magnetococcales bacterium]
MPRHQPVMVAQVDRNQCSRTIFNREGEENMQINVQVEVSPQEARAFLGLPDVQPLQNEVLEKMKQRMLTKMDEFESLFDPGKAVESYFSLYPQWLDAVKKFGVSGQK